MLVAFLNRFLVRNFLLSNFLFLSAVQPTLLFDVIFMQIWRDLMSWFRVEWDFQPECFIGHSSRSDLRQMIMKNVVGNLVSATSFSSDDRISGEILSNQQFEKAPRTRFLM